MSLVTNKENVEKANSDADLTNYPDNKKAIYKWKE
jgi:hypothetical protein